MSIAGADLERLEATARRYADRAEQREQAQRTLAQRGILHVDEPQRVTARLARLNADWTLARAIEATPEGASTGRSLDATTPELFGADVLGLERLMGRNDLIDVTFLERGALAARSIGRITVRGAGGTAAKYGTGSLISPRLLMTNHHVLADPQEAARSYVEFNYQAGLDGLPLTPSVFALDPGACFATDPTLDFTIVAVQSHGTTGGSLEPFAWLHLIEQEGKVLRGELVNIIQHPNGEPKQVAVRENRIVDRLELFLHYETDTAPGSSGAPVFNDSWEVLALHHSGVPKRDAQGNFVAVDGSAWKPEMGEDRLAWVANEGARISRVLQALRAQPLSDAAAALRAEIFAAAPAPTAPTAATAATAGAVDESAGGTPAAAAVGEARHGGGAARGDDTVARVTIPVEISVSVGAENALMRAQASRTARAHAVSASAAAAAAERRAALLDLEASRGRVYYDAAADAAAREAYYAHIDAAREPDLFEALSAQLAGTHTNPLPYKPMRHVYPWVDLHPDGGLRSIYSGRAFAPETFIEQDASVEQTRAEQLHALVSREAALGPAALEAELVALEAALPYNCEHVVPQSSFAAREPMRGDLHHLFACESGCNSFRGNTPYFDFDEAQEVTRDACGRREEGRFEPAAGKGPVARATLYFLLRYPSVIGDETRELQPDRLELLLSWHRDFLADDYERHRNAAIAELQGNRNPLIDHPEWASQIGFAAGFGG